MNQAPMPGPLYRPNQQQYAPQPFQASRPQRPPRFGFQAPLPYPRPRSSASKPNCSSASYPSSHSQDEVFNDISYNRSYDSDPGFPYECNEIYAYHNDSSYMSEGNSLFLTCLDTSFSERSERDFGANPYGSPQYLDTYAGSENYNCSSEYLNISSNYQNNHSPAQNFSNFRKFSKPTSFGNATSTPKSQYRKKKMQAAVPESQIHGERKVASKRPLKRKAPQPTHHCDVCDLDFTSQIPLDMHLRGSKHMKKIKALETLRNLQSQGHANPNDSVTNAFRCEACAITLNGALQLQTHFDGSKHKNKVKELESKLANTLSTIQSSQQNGDGQPKIVTSLPDTQTAALQPKTAKVAKLSCDVCDVIVNSEIQLLQHMGSKKHKAKVEGKPLPKKKFVKEHGGNEAPTAEGAVNDVAAGNDTDSQPVDAGETVHGIPHLFMTFVHKETLK